MFDASSIWDSAEERAAEMPVDDAAAERAEALILAMPDGLRRALVAYYADGATVQQGARMLRLSVREYRAVVLSGCRWIGHALLARAGIAG